jgi:hypothetical protein
MANDLKLNTEMATQSIQAVADLFDAGTNYLQVYDDTDSIPADADDGHGTNVMLVQITLPTPAFGTASAGAVSKTGTWSGTCVATGTANYYRLVDGSGSGEIQGTVGLTAGTFDLEFGDITWSTDGTVTIDTFTLTQPES